MRTGHGPWGSGGKGTGASKGVSIWLLRFARLRTIDTVAARGRLWRGGQGPEAWGRLPSSGITRAGSSIRLGWSPDQALAQAFHLWSSLPGMRAMGTLPLAWTGRAAVIAGVIVAFATAIVAIAKGITTI